MQTVHEDIHDDVVERLKKAYAQVRIGDPLEGKWFDKNIYIYIKSTLFLHCSESEEDLYRNSKVYYYHNVLLS